MKIVTVGFAILIFGFIKNSDEEYINEYAVEMDLDSKDPKFDLDSYNLKIIRHVSSLGNVYHLEHISDCSDLACQQSTSHAITEWLRKHPSVRRVQQQEDLDVEQKSNTEYLYTDKELNEEVQKKSIQELEDSGVETFDALLDVKKRSEEGDDGDYWIHDVKPEFTSTDDTLTESQRKSVLSDIPDFEYDLSSDDKLYLKLVDERRERLRGIYFNDPEANNLWQYNNYGQFDRMNPGMDMNIYPAYKAGYTGKGVVVTVIDDGLDTQHSDITKNYDPAASMDFNDPHNTYSSPRGKNRYRKMPLIEGHGTECASVIGGVANNSFCAHGVAYNVNLGGIRMLARNMVTDLLEAYALTHNNQYIDIYSNSWGPKDSGTKTSPVTHYVSKAFKAGAELGRGGKGSIFLFAAGNGGLKYDHCGGDGLVNNPFTIAVTAINIHGRKPAYTEECSAISITAAVGGYGYDQMYERDDIDPVLIASMVNGKCAKRFLGTSAATPLISGCIALAFEANPTLSWRDVQHLLTISSRIPNSQESVWQQNTAGFLTSHRYGFGLLDCSGLIYNAVRWSNVGERRSCIAGKTNAKDDLLIRRKRRTRLSFETRACENSERSIDFLEHVLVHTKIKHTCRGDLTLILSSPTETRSFLLKSRKNDMNNATITFSHLSLMNWGEKPKGTWRLDVVDIGRCDSEILADEESGKIIDAILEFYGTKKTDSAIYKNQKLIDDYFENIKLERPDKSIILNEREIYDFYNEQRKYFIQTDLSKHKNTFQKGL